MKKIFFFETEEWEKDYFEKNLTGFDLKFQKEPLNKDNLPKEKDVEAISVFVRSKVDETVLNNFPNLKLVTTRSTGFDHVDLPAAAKKGIVVCYVPHYGTNTVAEFTFGLMLMLSRRLYDAAYRMKEKESFTYQGLKGFDLKGKTLGVIGTGNIGRHVIKMANSFEMNVIAYDAFPQKNLESELKFRYVEKLENLLSQSDIITIHVPLMPVTRHLINKDSVKFIKKGAYLINTSRGEIVETSALALAIKNGIIAGAALDVVEDEKDIQKEEALLEYGYPSEEVLKTILSTHILLRMDNVIITPHTAFNTQEALERILKTTADNIKGFFDGKTVNKIPGLK